MNKKKLLLLASIFALVLVVTAINIGAAQYLAIQEGWKNANAYAAPRYYIDDGGGGNDPGGGKEPGKTVNATLTITRIGAGSMDTDSTHVIAGRSNVALTRLEFRGSGNNDIIVKKIQFGISADGRAATAEGVSDEVLSVSLKRCTDASCVSKTSVGLDYLPIEPTGIAAGTVRASTSTGFFAIPKGESRYFTLEAAVLSPVLVGSSAQADSGTDLYASVALSNFEAAVGSSIITRFTTSTGGTSLGVVGTRKVLLKAQPTLSIAKPAGAVVTNGLTPVIDITVGADGGAAALKALGLNIGATGATVFASTTVTDLTSNTPVAVSMVSGNTIPSGGSGDVYIVFANPEIITPGSPKTYRVNATTGNVSSSTPGSARIITKLDRDETAIINSQTVSYFLGPNGDYYGGNTRAWIWSDLSDDQAGIETNTDWANAYLIRPFPQDTVTVTN